MYLYKYRVSTGTVVAVPPTCTATGTCKTYRRRNDLEKPPVHTAYRYYTTYTVHCIPVPVHTCTSTVLSIDPVPVHSSCTGYSMYYQYQYQYTGVHRYMYHRPQVPGCVQVHRSCHSGRSTVQVTVCNCKIK